MSIFRQWHFTILCCSSIPCFPTDQNNIVKFTFLMSMAQYIKFTFHACFPCFPGSSNPNYLPQWDPWKHNMNTIIFIQKKRPISQFPSKQNTNFPISIQKIHQFPPLHSPFNQAIWHFSLVPERIASRWLSGLVTPGAKIWGRRRRCESGDLRLMSNDWRDLVFYTQEKMWFSQPKFAETASIVWMILSCKSSSPL